MIPVSLRRDLERWQPEQTTPTDCSSLSSPDRGKTQGTPFFAQAANPAFPEVPDQVQRCRPTSSPALSRIRGGCNTQHYPARRKGNSPSEMATKGSTRQLLNSVFPT